MSVVIVKFHKNIFPPGFRRLNTEKEKQHSKLNEFLQMYI